jgi:hypothetical protein
VSANGSERLDYHGGRRLTVPGVGLVEVLDDGESVRVLESLSPRQQEVLEAWLRDEWPLNKLEMGGY